MLKVIRSVCLISVLFAAVPAFAQREREIPAPAQADEAQYGRRFFLQLRGIFGRFRDSDLQRVFDAAQPIQCSELINEKGEWRTVAFFNEKRELGDWYRSNFDEVKSDLSVFSFKGVCKGDRGPVQLTTKFPVTESLLAAERGNIGLDQVDINVNAPVGANYSSSNQAYTFDLPYLYLISRDNGEMVYSLDPPSVTDKYATDVYNHWACKSVSADAVTYQFLICKTNTASRDASGRTQSGFQAFGSTAYFILSDGKEASSSVKLNFGDSSDPAHSVVDASGPPADEPADGPLGWQVPDADEKVVDLAREEFRIRFDPPSWIGRTGTAEVLSGQSLASLEASRTSPGADYCVWLPGTANPGPQLLAQDPETSILYSLTAHNPDGQSAASIVFDFRAITGVHLGTLQCSFQRAPAVASINFGRLTAIIGKHLTIEVR